MFVLSIINLKLIYDDLWFNLWFKSRDGVSLVRSNQDVPPQLRPLIQIWLQNPKYTQDVDDPYCQRLHDGLYIHTNNVWSSIIQSGRDNERQPLNLQQRKFQNKSSCNFYHHPRRHFHETFCFTCSVAHFHQDSLSKGETAFQWLSEINYQQCSFVTNRVLVGNLVTSVLRESREAMWVSVSEWPLLTSVIVI